MLARRRSIRLNNEEIERTPLLIPSFSSKGFEQIGEIVEYSSEIIDSAMLISAYDLHYKYISPPFNFASLIFLDSGGYEASKDADLSDFGDREHQPRQWSRELHDAQLASWKPGVPSVIISYDHPSERMPIADQISRAEAMPIDGDCLREILIKPERTEQRFVSMSSVVEHIHRLSAFDIIGVTEKQLGNSIIERMKNVATLRLALGRAGLDTPVHIFGSLDTITTPMYFLAGADIFDGLTWLRFAYHEGHTIYKHDYGALKLGVTTKTHVIDGCCWSHNYSYLKELEAEMKRFLHKNDFTFFKYHGPLFREALESIMEATGM